MFVYVCVLFCTLNFEKKFCDSSLIGGFEKLI